MGDLVCLMLEPGTISILCGDPGIPRDVWIGDGGVRLYESN